MFIRIVFSSAVNPELIFCLIFAGIQLLILTVYKSIQSVLVLVLILIQSKFRLIFKYSSFQKGQAVYYSGSIFFMLLYYQYNNYKFNYFPPPFIEEKNVRFDFKIIFSIINFSIEKIQIFQKFQNRLDYKLNIDYQMYQKSSQLEFNKAVSDLQLRIRNDVADRQEIKFILMELLGYPSIEKAEQHHNSSRLGTNDLLSKQQEIQKKVKEKDISDFQICSCCGLLLQNQYLPFTTSLKQINLGIGVNLFMRDLLYYAFIFLFMFCFYSIYAISTNASNFQKDTLNSKAAVCLNGQPGLCDISAGSKVLNQSQNQSKIYDSKVQACIGIALVVIWGVFNIIKTHFQEKQIVEIQEKRVSASDFTLMIENFPKVHLGQTQEQALNFVQDIFNKYYAHQKLTRQCPYPYQVVSVCIARPLYQQNRRNVEHKEKVKNELYERQQIFRQWIRYRAQHEKFPIDYKARQRKYEEYNSYFTQIFDKQMFPKVDLEQKNIIFVTMRHSKARQQIQTNNAPVSIIKFWKYFKQTDFPVQQVKISKAPEPEQIKWQNIGFSKGQRIIRRILVWIATVLLIGISIAISIGVSILNEQQKLKQKYLAASVAVSVIVTLINFGIQIAIIYFSSLEYEYISSWQQSSLAIKIAVGQLVNSIGVPIIVAKVLKELGYQKTYLKANGVADDIFFIAMLNILVPVSYIFDFYEIMLKVIRWWKRQPYRRLEMYGQKQLNKYYGNYKFDIGYQYAYLIKTAIFTSFFVTLQPVIAIFAPFALVFFYMTTKRNLFDHIQRPAYHYTTTNTTVDIILQFSLLFFGIGSFFVNNLNEEEDGVSGTNYNETYKINLVIVFVSLAFLVIVPFRIFYCCIKKPELENKDYFKKKMLISTDYDRTNPITKISAISEFEHYIRNLDEEEGLPDAVQLIKLQSTLQNRQTIRMDINFRNSISRMSRLSSLKLEPIQKKNTIELQPEFNYDKNFYEQIVHQNSVHFGKQESQMKNSIRNEGNLFPISQISRIQAEQSNTDINTKKRY